MLLIILGLIIGGGALFLILSQRKPKDKGGRRLRGGYHGFGFGGFDGLGAMQDENSGFKMPFEDAMNPQAGAENNPTNAAAGGPVDSDESGKVLFIFGSDEREERPLDGDGNKDE